MLLTLANPSLTGLRSVDISGINEDGLGNTFLGITKGALLVEDKEVRRLTLSLLKPDNIYSLGASVPNELGLFPIFLDTTFFHSRDPSPWYLLSFWMVRFN